MASASALAALAASWRVGKLPRSPPAPLGVVDGSLRGVRGRPPVPPGPGAPPPGTGEAPGVLGRGAGEGGTRTPPPRSGWVIA